MAVLVGIDEAGFGPILGPLTVSASAFRLSDDQLKSDMWTLLRKSVGKTKKKLTGRLLITDSKKAYSRSSGIGHLQKTVLASLSLLGLQDPDTVADILTALCPRCVPRLDSYPWYQDCSSVALDFDKDSIAIATQAFARNLSVCQMSLLSMKSYCFDVGHYNDIVSRVNNKSTVLFGAVCELINDAFKNFGNDNLQIVIDRQGGRVNYVPSLQRMFPRMSLEVLKQSERLSSYLLQADGRAMKLHFTIKADLRYLPVSLASMTSKYLRELLIERINNYFIKHCADLKPTAGYWKDGLRFINDLKTHASHVNYDSQQLIRSR